MRYAGEAVLNEGRPINAVLWTLHHKESEGGREGQDERGREGVREDGREGRGGEREGGEGG